MASGTSWKAVEELLSMVSSDETLHAQFIHPLSCEDVVSILEIHDYNHSVAGMLR